MASDNETDAQHSTTILDISEDLVESPEHKQAGITELSFDGLLHPALRLHEDLTNGCGGQLWPAGLALASYLLDESRLLSCANKAILELGAGGGLVSLAIALGLKQCHAHSQHHITVTDQAAMMPLMKRNVTLNSLDGPNVTTELLDWAEESHLTPPDVLLAAECVYFEPAFPLLLKTMESLIGENTICYFIFKKRRRADMHFVRMAKKVFDVQGVGDGSIKESLQSQNLYFYQIRKKRP
ncbi:MAG: hypothetical protein M1828_004196 [Chrysothrix sp. TS-e1954]|nr:MAG: hypothetical protein M1828_004196 [Chrysothrix sp. TS-e1954]